MIRLEYLGEGRGRCGLAYSTAGIVRANHTISDHLGSPSGNTSATARRAAACCSFPGPSGGLGGGSPMMFVDDAIGAEDTMSPVEAGRSGGSLVDVG